jgi:hypothetical protein
MHDGSKKQRGLWEGPAWYYDGQPVFYQITCRK